ncbi:MAG: hypothetical protein KBB56_04995 [Acidobacteria bacterium]|nr:hypothetical protein [Acidobacteriota bacterium]
MGRYVAHVIREVAARYEFRLVELAVMPAHVHNHRARARQLHPNECAPKVLHGLRPRVPSARGWGFQGQDMRDSSGTLWQIPDAARRLLRQTA